MKFGMTIRWSSLLVLGLFIQGCKITVPDKITIETSSSPSCSAALNSVSVALSGNPVPILVSANGGVGPYVISGIGGSFSNSTTISRTYTNHTLANIVLDDSIEIVDSKGKVKTCSFKVTVTPEDNTSNVACSLSLSPSTVNVNSNVAVSVTGQGGQSPYTFSNLIPGADGQIVTALTSNSSSSATAVVKYSASGAKTASVMVTDAQGFVASCSKSETVLPIPSLSITATPSGTVDSTLPITLVANASNFVPTQYVFSTTESGITLSDGTTSGSSITTTSNSITVRASDLGTHSFNVVAAATNSTVTASNTVALSFTRVTLNCALTHPSGSYNAGSTIPFTVSATGLVSGETLIMDQFAVSNGAVLTNPLATTMNVRFDSAGYKVISAVAHSSLGRPCNSSAQLQDTVDIIGSLSCSAYTSPSYSAYGQYFVAGASVSNAIGLAVVTRIDTYSWVSLGGYFTGNTTAWMSIYDVGVFPLTMTVQDSAGRTTTCTTNQVVHY